MASLNPARVEIHEDQSGYPHLHHSLWRMSAQRASTLATGLEGWNRTTKIDIIDFWLLLEVKGADEVSTVYRPRAFFDLISRVKDRTLEITMAFSARMDRALSGNNLSSPDDLNLGALLNRRDVQLTICAPTEVDRMVLLDWWRSGQLSGVYGDGLIQVGTVVSPRAPAASPSLVRCLHHFIASDRLDFPPRIRCRTRGCRSSRSSGTERAQAGRCVSRPTSSTLAL